MASSFRVLACAVAVLLAASVCRSECPTKCEMPGYRFPINTPNSPLVEAVHNQSESFGADAVNTCQNACGDLGHPYFYYYSAEKLPNCVCLGPCDGKAGTNPTIEKADDSHTIGMTSSSCRSPVCSAERKGNCAANPPCPGATVCKSYNAQTTSKCCCEGGLPVPVNDANDDGLIIDCSEKGKET